MRNGFIFNHNKCVSCNACSAACILENGWNVTLRNIYTYNSDAEIASPVINLSMACNHCELAVCMKGCPSAAISRDLITGAIIIDDAKCIGCRYCQWNCPYDAPKYDIEKGTIAKCNLCYNGIKEGREPACSSACPTGALSFSELSDFENKSSYSWFPDKNLNPAIKFVDARNQTPLKIIPGNNPGLTDLKQNQKPKNVSGELSLIAFSFLATISVASVISSFLKGVFPEIISFISLLFITGFISIFHLGKKFRSWRSVMNLRESPLSREIALFILYSAVSSVTVVLRIPVLLIFSSVTGLILILMIDSIYVYSDRNKSVIYHPGQTFLSVLIIVSFFSGLVLPFVFMALIKLVLSFYRLVISKLNSSDTGIRFLRIVFLIIPGLSFILLNSHPEKLIIIIFLAGEFLDRILFYIDFNPLNINTLINEHLNIVSDEKKRY
jgi:Fe-S-cluster-containing dehydrogenase component/DMSO reductase anchor subunit